MAEVEESVNHNVVDQPYEVENDKLTSPAEDSAVSVTEPRTEDESSTAPEQPGAGDGTIAQPDRPPLTPPEDCEKITPDGGVLKKVLEPGEPGTKPTLHARCLVHYAGYLASSGDLFMDTRRDTETGEPVIVVAGRNAAAQETGLCLAAATMSRGEKALVYVQDPSYGYGKVGSFSFPCVPPDSQLVYEVEMVNWEGIEETDDDQNRGGLLFEERLERAERRREAGNRLYKEGQYKDALAKYALALSYMDEDFMYQLEGHYLDKAEAVKLRIHLNMAAAQLNTRDYNTAIYNCGQVLNMDPNNVKALFRRGKAAHALGRTEDAEKDLEKAKELDPTDKAIIAELNAVMATKKLEKRAVSSMYKGLYKPPATAAAAAAKDAGGAGAGAAAQAAGGTTGTASGAAPASASSSSVWKTSGSGRESTEIRPVEEEGTSGAGSGGVARRGGAGSGGKGGAGGGKGGEAAKAGGRQAGGKGGAVVAGRAQGLLGLLAWLWAVIVAAVLGKQRRAVPQRAQGKGR